MGESDNGGVSRSEFHWSMRALYFLLLLILLTMLSRTRGLAPPGPIYPEWLTDALLIAPIVLGMVGHWWMALRGRPRRQ